MTTDDYADLKRRADREYLRGWRRRNRLKECLRAIRATEARQVERALRDLKEASWPNVRGETCATSSPTP